MADDAPLAVKNPWLRDRYADMIRDRFHGAVRAQARYLFLLVLISAYTFAAHFTPGDVVEVPFLGLKVPQQLVEAFAVSALGILMLGLFGTEEMLKRLLAILPGELARSGLGADPRNRQRTVNAAEGASASCCWRSSRGRTRTCDPLTRNRPARLLGSRKLSGWRAGNPDENPETGPNRTQPTVPTPYPAKKSVTREVCVAGAAAAIRTRDLRLRRLAGLAVTDGHHPDSPPCRSIPAILG
jgi:hypothetical protein